MAIPVESAEVEFRTAATFNLAIVLIACVLAALAMPGLPVANPGSAALRDVSPVRVVGAPGSERPCSEQTWPYLEARCLTRAPDVATNGQTAAPSSPPVAATPVPSQAAVTTVPTPITPASPNVAEPLPADTQEAAVVPQPETTGLIGQEFIETPPSPGPRRRHFRSHRDRNTASF